MRTIFIDEFSSVGLILTGRGGGGGVDHNSNIALMLKDFAVHAQHMCYMILQTVGTHVGGTFRTGSMA